jgi:hypothetical protein
MTKIAYAMWLRAKGTFVECLPCALHRAPFAYLNTILYTLRKLDITIQIRAYIDG